MMIMYVNHTSIPHKLAITDIVSVAFNNNNNIKLLDFFSIYLCLHDCRYIYIAQ